MDFFVDRSIGLWSAAQARWLALRHEPDRGDVPGWVMVTVMTAGLVVAVFTVFRTAIVGAVKSAMDDVVSNTGK
jgi:hypothetical protein